MSIQRAIKCFAWWTLTSIVSGTIVGAIIGLGDTGHVGSLSTILISVVAGANFGIVGGAVFAPLFSWLEPKLPGRSARGGVAIVLGTLSGLLGIYVVDSVAGVAHAFAVGSVIGAITGFICMLLVSEYGHHNNAA